MDGGPSGHKGGGPSWARWLGPGDDDGHPSETPRLAAFAPGRPAGAGGGRRTPLGGSASAPRPGSSRLLPAAGACGEITLHPQQPPGLGRALILCSRPSLTGQASWTGGLAGLRAEGQPRLCARGAGCEGRGYGAGAPREVWEEGRGGQLPCAQHTAPLAPQCHGPAQPATLPGPSDSQPPHRRGGRRLHWGGSWGGPPASPQQAGRPGPGGSVEEPWAGGSHCPARWLLCDSGPAFGAGPVPPAAPGGCAPVTPSYPRGH